MKSIQELLQTAFNKYAGYTAIRYKGQHITYAGIEQLAGKYAHLLDRESVAAGSFIGVHTKDKLSFIAAVIGILSRRCVFVPIDPLLPAGRIAELTGMIDFTGIFTDDKALFTHFCGPQRLFDEADIAAGTYFTGSIFTGNYQPQDPIYTFFTSGTNGLPKAVLGKNESLSHFVTWEASTFDVNETSCVSQFSAMGFDAVLRDIFLPLVVGATLCIPPAREIIFDQEILIGWLEENNITHMHCVPGIFRLLKEGALTALSLPHLRYIIMAGEELRPSELKLWFALLGARIGLVNLYGATEVTMAKTWYLISPEDVNMARIPVGRAMSNTQVFVMDKDLQICDEQVTGDIYIRTPYRTLGYYRDEEQNKLKFIPNSYSDDPDDMLYNTGDLGYMLPDGNLVFLGRKDDQVKIRGNRVAPGEVENYLLRHPDVNNCVVIVRDHVGEKELCCYYVGGQLTPQEIRRYAREGLPDYMVPVFFVKLLQLPLTVNGKIDKAALPEPAFTAEEYIPPHNHTEATLVALWSKLLHIPAELISVNTSFFDTGGNSIRLMSLLSEIHKVFNTRISLQEIFNQSTIEKIAALIQSGWSQAFAGITPVQEKEYYRVSSAQHRVYFICQLDPFQTAYNMPGRIELNPSLDRQTIESAIQQLFDRHESFRTSFHMINEACMQRVAPEVNFILEETGGDPVTDFVKPFNLAEAPLFRAHLVRRTGSLHLLYDMHHIICDGTSEQMLEKELSALLNGRKLQPVSLQYKDFAEWEQTEPVRKEIEKQGLYWKTALGGNLPLLQLPVNYARGSANQAEDIVLFSLEETELLGLRRLCFAYGLTPAMVLHGAFHIVLAKVCGQEDIITGMLSEGRMHADTHTIIGMFVNFLPILSHPASTVPVADFFTGMKNSMLAAQANSLYPFDELVAALAIKWHDTRNPVFDVVFNFLSSFTEAEPHQDQEDIFLNQALKRGAKVDLLLTCKEIGKKIFFGLSYNSNLFERATIERIRLFFIQVLSSVEDNWNQTIGDVDMFSPDEKVRAVSKLSQSLKQPLKFNTVQELCRYSFIHYREHVAIEWGDQSCSYAALEGRSAAIARKLAGMKLPDKRFIGIFTDDRIGFVSAIIGILAAGHIFVPIDKRLPPERIKGLLQEIPLAALIADNATQIPGFIGDTPVITWPEDPGLSPLFPLSMAYSPDDAVYVFFTSGSTGKPKAIIGRNESLCHFVEWEAARFRLDASCRVSQLTAPGFDAILRDIFVPILTGGTICIPPDRDLLFDPGLLALWIQQKQITLLHCVPSIFRMLKQQTLFREGFTTLKHILLSGEEIKPNELKSWYENSEAKVDLVNLYGPTETTMIKTCYFIRECDGNSNRVAIGSAIEGSQVVILDEQQRLLPPLVPGDIYIRTPYRTLGYFRQGSPDKHTFLPNPFNRRDPDDLLYKTGDIGRLLANGELGYLGRKDNQVKIRGNRVAPGEIENLLTGFPGISQAAVLPVTDEKGDIELAGYYMANKQLSVAALKDYLSNVLPEYMVPASLAQLSDWPLLPNGKLDHKALPVPEKSSDLYVPPRNAEEYKVQEIWSKILSSGDSPISIHTKFFDAGGNSLKLMALISGIHREFDVRLSLGEIFKSPTIAGISAGIRKARPSSFLPLKQREKQAYYPLTPSQQRLYFLQHLHPGSRAYTMYMKLDVTGLSLERIHSTLNKLVARHESLRTSFRLFNEQPVQIVHDHLELDVTEMKEWQLEEAFMQPFDLSVAPLLMAAIVADKERKNLFIKIHHIINDAVTERILSEEFNALLLDQVLPPLKIQYRDYERWKSSIRHRNDVDMQAKFWREELAGKLPDIILPYDLPPVEDEAEYPGSVTYFSLPPALYEQVLLLLKAHDLTLFMYFFTVYNVLLFRYSRSQELLTAFPATGRNNPDLEGVAGFFVNMLLVRSYPGPTQSFFRYVSFMKEKIGAILENSDYEFDRLMKDLQHSGTGSRPLVKTVFTMQHAHRLYRFEEGEDNAVSAYAFMNSRETKFELCLDAIEHINTTRFRISYAHNLFHAHTIDKIKIHLLEIIQQTVANFHVSLEGIHLSVDKKKARHNTMHMGNEEFDL
ncbi:amino acid adenylation domain-containing protein [Chitinophaga polysaccharea]|uniref:non-ribosomal peptide synthetase n=1 Tax=Chitinophaga polysaccharea TaxID=1293035 RepID=UPI001455B696|nr:non-ribosomal peptide synthetase [Chitinophaga polysaccharea]NLR57675.1 amino acid adenylation domain-containing protein [Chitinophaga polysaccharea]